MRPPRKKWLAPGTERREAEMMPPAACGEVSLVGEGGRGWEKRHGFGHADGLVAGLEEGGDFYDQGPDGGGWEGGGGHCGVGAA